MSNLTFINRNLPIVAVVLCLIVAIYPLNLTKVLILLLIMGVFSYFIGQLQWSTILVVIVATLVGNYLPSLVPSVSSYVESNNHENVEILATIQSDPEYRGYYQRFNAEPLDIETDYNRQIQTDPYLKVKVGDMVAIRGELTIPEAFMSEGGRIFPYPEFLLARNIESVIKRAQIKVVSESKFSPRSALAQLKSRFIESVNSNLAEPYSSLANGITIGANDSMSDDVSESFRRVGLTHIVVLSGFNIAIVVIAFSAVFAALPYWLAIIFVTMAIWTFVVLVGAAPAIVRAGLMATAAVYSRLFGDYLNGLAILSLAVIAMVIVNPLIVRYDPSFQLSILATIGIIMVTPIIERYLTKISQKWALREILATTLATQIMVFPWLIYIIGDVSIVAPISNILILPLIPWAMAGTFLIFLSTIIFPPIAIVFSIVTTLLLGIVFIVSNTFTAFPYASISLPPVPIGLVIVLYGLIFIALRRLKDHAPKQPNSKLR